MRETATFGGVMSNRRSGPDLGPHVASRISQTLPRACGVPRGQGMEKDAEAEAPAQVSSVGSGSNDARAGNSDGAAVRDSAKGPSVSPARLRDDTTGRGVAVVAKGDGK